MLVWGDSLSSSYGIPLEQGWVALLQKRLDETQTEAWQVINGSISGETVNGGLTRLPDALAEHKPDIVLLGLGSNDGLQGKPLNYLRTRLARMIDLALDTGARIVLLGNRIPPNYGARYADGFAQVYADLAESKDISMVPFLLAGVATDLDLMQVDGLHPTAAAQPRLLENVWPYVEELL